MELGCVCKQDDWDVVAPNKKSIIFHSVCSLDVQIVGMGHVMKMFNYSMIMSNREV